MRINDIFCQWHNENRFLKEKKESKLKWPEGAADFVHFTMVQIQKFLSNFQLWLGPLKKYVDMDGCSVYRGTLHQNGLVAVISWYTGENWESKRTLPRNIPRFWLNQDLFLSIVFVTKKFEKFDLMWRHFFKKLKKTTFHWLFYQTY